MTPEPATTCYEIGFLFTLVTVCCRYYYSIALLVLQYVIPISVLVFTYTSIAVMVWGKRPPGEAENVRDQRMARSKRKVRSYKSIASWSFSKKWEIIVTVHCIDSFVLFFIFTLFHRNPTSAFEQKEQNQCKHNTQHLAWHRFLKMKLSKNS